MNEALGRNLFLEDIKLSIERIKKCMKSNS
jgi:hypothetical protein